MFNPKILVPVKNLIAGVELVKAGAGELYFGIVSSDWEGKYDYKTVLNRRDGKLANISSYEDAKKLIDFARKNNSKTYITLNNSPIVDNIDLIKVEIKNCININPDGLIVKDILIAKLIRELNSEITIHCSSLNQVINKYAINFWVENYNVSRIILPRNTGVSEIIDLCNSFPELEFEIFIKNDWCYNSDGICSSLHLEGLKEGIPYVCNREINYKSENEDDNFLYKNLLGSTNDCKICQLYQLKNLKNLVSIKIVGREKPFDIIIKDLKFIQNSLKYLNLSDSNKEYIDFNINSYKKIISKNCDYDKCEFYNTYYN